MKSNPLTMAASMALTITLLATTAISIAGCSLVGSEPAADDTSLFPSYNERAVNAASDDGENRVRGIVHFFGDDARIEAPSSAKAGEAVEVTIATFGGGCDSAGGVSVEVDALQATVEPYDFTVTGEDVVCPAVLKELPRSVQVTFHQRGEAILRIVGLRVDADHRDGAEEIVEVAISVE